MTWLLIVFGVALVISPLMWLKQSPHQHRITGFRRQANSLFLQVCLHRRPDARVDELRLESVCYRLPWRDKACRQDWILQRCSQRGWESPYPAWRWMADQADSQWGSALDEVLLQMPVGVSAVIADGNGIGVIWDERGETEDVTVIYQLLLLLRQKAEEICL